MSDSHDAVVIGAGAGGAAAAWRMTMRGWRVLLVDAGPAFDPDRDYGLDQPDWERERFRHRDGSQGEVTFAPLQRLDVAHDTLRSWSLGQGRSNRGATREVSGPGYHHVRGIGGSTLHFVGEAHRLHPEAFAVKSRHGQGADWPLAYADLEPFYAEVERVLGVAGADDATSLAGRWRSTPFPLPPHPLSLASRALGEGARKAGHAWVVNPRAALSRVYDGRPPCNYCGGCTHGCPRRDKGSADITFIAKARATGRLAVRPLTTLVGIEVEPGRGGAQGRRASVRAVQLATANGERMRVPVQRLVLACGAIETPRALLLAPALARLSPQVGRNFLESVAYTTTGRTERALLSHGGLPADAISWTRNTPGALPGIVGGFRVSAAIHEADMVGAIAHAQRAVPGFGHAHKQAMRRAVGSLVAAGAVGESLPHPGSFVDLDPTARDAQGRPLARIHSQVDAMAIRRLRAMAEATRAIVRGAGAVELVEEFGTWDHFSSAHVFGTCRMGRTAADSVVDRDLRLHGAANAWICDASVFPSSGGGEAPSLTIQALALRAVDAMA